MMWQALSASTVSNGFLIVVGSLAVDMAGAECCIPAPPSEHYAVGKEESWEGIDVYVNHPPAAPAAAVILVADVFGWKTPLLRKLADKVAGAGFLVVVPDLLYGDPYTPGTSPPLMTWIQGHPAQLKPVDDTKKLVEVLHSKGISSTGVTGFCWGAKVAVILDQGTDIKAAVLCHPSLVTEDDIKNVKGAIAILAAESDHITPVVQVMEFKAILEQANKESLVKIYPGTSHGWTVRYDVNDEAAVKKAEEAHNDMITWFQKHLLQHKL